ncbi:hypothetical protein A2U01_0102194, partial [Trifolium medium]|nr:hypothetical protein [Trifolium medium]
RDVLLPTLMRSMTRCSMSLPCPTRIGGMTLEEDVHAYRARR